MIQTLTGTEDQLRLDLTTLHRQGDLVRFADRGPRPLRRRTPWGPRRYAVRVELAQGARVRRLTSATDETRRADIARAAGVALGLAVGGAGLLALLIAAVWAHLAELTGLAVLAALLLALAGRVAGGGRRVMVGSGCGCVVIHICGH
jgi:hypothetical protein